MFKKMSIGQKLYVGFGLLALMVIGMMLFAIGQLSRIYSVTDNITNNMLPSLQYASAMQESLLNTRRSEMGAIIGYHDHNPDDINGSIASFENYARAFSEAQQAYSQLPFSSELERQTFAQLGAEANDYFAAHQSLISAIQRGDPAGIADGRAQTRTALDALSQPLAKLRSINREMARTLTDSAFNEYGEARSVSLLFGAGTVALVLLVAWLLTRQIRRPLDTLLAQTRKVAGGDLGSRLSLTQFNQDEMGELAKAFGDMQESLRHLVVEVSGSVAQLSSAAEEISTVAAQSAGNTQQQQSELTHLATAMNEMQATVQEISRNTSSAAQDANQASQFAGQGDGVVVRTVASIEQVAAVVEQTAGVISQLADDSRNIGMVLEVIRGIAEQTNLLALNAAIEAARAGEQGRGFAVVADEVRTLAKRTQDSTSEINRIITELQQRTEQAGIAMQESQTQIRSTVETAREAGGALSQIKSAVSGIFETSTQIATATEQQEVVSHELNVNITNVNGAAQEVAEGAKQMAQACNELNQLAVQLQEMVRRFRT